jgi:hypothetical protein
MKVALSKNLKKINERKNDVYFSLTFSLTLKQEKKRRRNDARKAIK